MAQEVRLTATITGEVAVGDNPQPANQLTLSIENQGDAIVSESRVPPNLYLKGQLGQGEAALFAKKEDARDYCTIVKPDGWEYEWDFPSDEAFSLKLYTYNDTLFDKGASISIKLGKVISKTAPPGPAALSFASDLSTKAQSLPVVKSAKVPDIIFFTSDPEVGVKNLPNSNVTLKWRTYQLGKRELTRIGARPQVVDFTSDDGSTTINCGSADTTFKLKGYPLDGSQPIERDLRVDVLRPDWYDQQNTLYEGDPGYPSPANREALQALKLADKRVDLEPTLLLNANDQSLYGIFRHNFQGKERALLFNTTNPFGPWSLVPSSVADQQGAAIPERFSTSPGVYFNDALWLIGGSQIDPDIVSNEVWCLDPKERIWKSWGTADWEPRMGHAVLVFQNKENKEIWLMGGRGEAGNAWSDVWYLDVTTKKWKPLPGAPWAPRCLFSPAVFQGQIWLYGGALEPFSSTLYDDVYVYRNGSWAKRELTGIITGSDSRKPIASCLQEFNNRLCLFGKFRTVSARDKSESVEPLAFSLSTPSTSTWDSFPSDGLKYWGGDTTFSYRLLNFKNKMLIATALSYEKSNSVIKIYVPGPGISKLQDGDKT